jgi:hypothetical protein
MASTLECRHVTVSIDRPPGEVHAFVADPSNLPRWAKGLSGAIENVAGEWVADSPMGKVTVRFAPANALGVLDHDVVLPDGTTVRNPLRVVANGGGSELTFTLFRRPGMSEPEFAADAAAVERDLRELKRILEGSAA